MFEYTRLTTWFVREVLDAYRNWNEKDNVPKKIQELMMALHNGTLQHHK